MGTSEWSNSEKEIARQAFNLAYIRECKSIEEELQRRVSELHDPKGLWSIHTYLTEKLRETDRKYDYRYSALLMVFVRLLHEGWVTIEDLKGLSEDKIEAMKRMRIFSDEE
jgi:hypothetical protein